MKYVLLSKCTVALSRDITHYCVTSRVSFSKLTWFLTLCSVSKHTKESNEKHFLS